MPNEPEYKIPAENLPNTYISLMADTVARAQVIQMQLNYIITKIDKDKDIEIVAKIYDKMFSRTLESIKIDLYARFGQ